MHATLLAELGGIILALGLLGRMAGRCGQSPIPLYLLAGLAFGHGGLLSLSASEEFVATGAEIGVVLLLLMLGLEYTAADLVTSLKAHHRAGAVDFALNAVPGAAAALLLGWGPVDSARPRPSDHPWISSSGVIAQDHWATWGADRQPRDSGPSSASSSSKIWRWPSTCRFLLRCWPGSALATGHRV